MTAEQAGRLAGKMQAAFTAAILFTCGWMARNLATEELTYELSTGHYVALRLWRGECAEMQAAIADGHLVETTAPWGTKYTVRAVYCRERVLP